MLQGKVSKENAKAYLFAGKATFTLVNNVSGARITYTFRKSKQNDTYFVYVIKNGTEKYAGAIFERSKFHQGQKSQFLMSAVEILALQWLMRNIDKLDSEPKLDIYHDGRCAKCGKQLTVPESIATGLGSECAKKIGLHEKRQAVIKDLFEKPTHTI